VLCLTQRLGAGGSLVVGAVRYCNARTVPSPNMECSSGQSCFPARASLSRSQLSMALNEVLDVIHGDAHFEEDDGVRTFHYSVEPPLPPPQ